MKLINEKGRPWEYNNQKIQKTPMDFIEVQNRSLYIGICIGPKERDCVVLIYKDRSSWEIKTNINEDALTFLNRNIKMFSKIRYKNAVGTFLKDYLIFSIDARLTSPVIPEYYNRDVELERNHTHLNKKNGKLESYLKITNWINHFPASGTSKRVYLETSPLSNFPFKIGEIREVDKEKSCLIKAFKIINGMSGNTLNIKGWNEENFKDEYFRDAFGSMLVSIAYSRWKSNDKSGKDDFLKVVVDHDGVYWLLDYQSLKNEQVSEKEDDSRED